TSPHREPTTAGPDLPHPPGGVRSRGRECSLTGGDQAPSPPEQQLRLFPSGGGAVLGAGGRPDGDLGTGRSARGIRHGRPVRRPPGAAAPGGRGPGGPGRRERTSAITVESF